MEALLDRPWQVTDTWFVCPPVTAELSDFDEQDDEDDLSPAKQGGGFDEFDDQDFDDDFDDEFDDDFEEELEDEYDLETFDKDDNYGKSDGAAPAEIEFDDEEGPAPEPNGDEEAEEVDDE